ncbi:aspartate/glutamate racemase family protein [Sediminispirochaeta smaragdinae]|uniref:Asp/Glu/hydantoin racemase n=1 Tax=Sediminispirochaeta smaragdinae (strain DSM 11293 / JCM 15392 / SEBR 4228) TaxID=573413 RepID=E1R5K2_SEDSS|nr:aspartate/glutamate racemase family protein [Sediminispirochaeta smaragdinae]ADK82330.1 Asp/Glu/hydantoin racemase [Sediminispirochaeta smaragdinae DSM 11293]
MQEGSANKRGAIIIGGGVGPMAGVKLHEKIITFTITDGSDQDHLDLIHLSRSRLIPDRTRFLHDLQGPNPGTVMAELVASAVTAFQRPEDQMPVSLAAGVPCNTFHAPLVWNAFTKQLEQLHAAVKPVHMLDQTVEELRQRFAPGAHVGILSTIGTKESGVWRNAIQEAGFIPLETDQMWTEKVHGAIYDHSWGLKAKSPASGKAKAMLQEATEYLINKGADAIILGCTEIPLALREGPFRNVMLVDPVSSLARALIRTAGAKSSPFLKASY